MQRNTGRRQGKESDLIKAEDRMEEDRTDKTLKEDRSIYRNCKRRKRRRDYFL